jgi:hypothetical protein
VLAPPGVEDPISATFDLSDRVAQLAPTVRRMYRYTATILLIWIVIMALLILIGLGGSLVLSLLAVLGLVAGVIALTTLRETDRFFRAFVQRHRIIRLLREADPVSKIPEGRTPIERLARYLADSSDRVETAVREDPGRLRLRVSLPARPAAVAFDLALVVQGRWPGGRLGFGDPGFAVLARSGPDAPTVADLDRLSRDAAAAAPALGARVARLILLRTHPVPLPEDVYEYAVGHPAVIPNGYAPATVPVEIITEAADGSYEFVPHVLGVP